MLYLAAIKEKRLNLRAFRSSMTSSKMVRVAVFQKEVKSKLEDYQNVVEKQDDQLKSKALVNMSLLKSSLRSSPIVLMRLSDKMTQK